MPVWPQYINADLVEAANYRVFTQGTSVTAGAQAIAANPGDVIINKVTAGDASTYTVTLPPVSQGGPVCVKMTGAPGNVSNTMIVIPQVVDTVAGCLIDGFGSIKLLQVPEEYILASDGTNWWTVSKAHNTNVTW